MNSAAPVPVPGPGPGPGPDAHRGAAPPLARLLEQAGAAVRGVLDGRSLSDLLPAVHAALRPGTQALAFLALRRLGGARAVRARLAARPPAPAVDGVLLVAIALLWPDAAPPYADHTVVDQAVAAVRRGTPAAAGFVNAVLRRFLRERDALVAAVATEPEARWNHPAWWIDALRADWPDAWPALLEAAQARPPMGLRVNARRRTGADWLAEATAAGLAGRLAGPQAVVLDTPVPVERLPGFAAGDVSVQDLSAQRAAPLLLDAAPLPAGARVLDACAAPGGKTAHLLELADVDVLALDTDPARLARVDATLARLGLRARTRAGDGRRPAGWWDGTPFDAILLDAPCSASGIVRRHPDIRWLRRPGDIAALARIQAELLDALWPLLRPGGHLLYATCSIFRSEGERAIDAFLQRQTGREARMSERSPGHLLPVPDNGSTGDAPADGFFYALLRKAEAG